MVQQAYAGIRVLVAHRREARAEERFANEADLYKTRTLDLVKVDALFMPIIVMLVGLSTILTIYVGGLRVLAGDLELGHIFQFVFYVNLLTWPFASIGWVTSLVQKASASQAENQRLPRGGTGHRQPGEPSRLRRHPGIHRIQGRRPHLSRLGHRRAGRGGFHPRTRPDPRRDRADGQWKMPPSPNSSRGSYDPTVGHVLVDGVDLKERDLHGLREAIGYVPQDVFLFSDTIRANIGFGVDGAEEADIQQAARDADVHDNITGFPEGYDTLLGERGVNLEEGKSNVSYCAGHPQAPRILIFDDCLSAVDLP